MLHWTFLLILSGSLMPAALRLEAETQCRFYLANHSGTNLGLALSLEGQADTTGSCPLSSINIVLTVGDGTANHRLAVTQAWQTGHVYTAKAVVTAAGPQQLSVNGQSVGNLSGAFRPAAEPLYGSQLGQTQGTPAYVATEISLQISNAASSLSLPPDGNNTLPLPLILLAGGPAPWPAAFNEDPSQSTTLTATFRLDPLVPDPHQFDPYVDAYGQATYGNWPSKVSTDSDLQAAIAEEQFWLADNGPLGGVDIYGGSTLANWTDQATGYYHTAFHNNRWWLISPLGNPLFYIGLSGIYEGVTPVTGRESMFAQLPGQTGPLAPASSQNAYGDAQNTAYVSFDIANEIRKYGSTWRDAKNAVTKQRLASWAFAGAGKWTHPQPGLSVNPVLDHGAVPNVVPGGHPDVFDANIVSQLKATLTSQIGANVTNAYIIGWSVGNEKDEIVQTAEVQGILGLGAAVPAKISLVNQALAAIYGGSVSALATAWKITASTAADVYAARPAPPAPDLETLRRYYEQNYYATLYQTVKAIDPNHLYLGSWILPRDYPADWPIAASNCDVIGMDYYSSTFVTPDVDVLVRGTNKPVLIGEFSFPSAYGGLRGFGWSGYITPEITLSDSASGDAYAQWLQNTSAYPYLVGVEWFDYRDEPISGRGNTNGVGNISNGLLVGEDLAFGLVDVTDRPKYDLVNKVRAANIAALQGLGLLGSAPVLSSPPANGVTYVSGGLVPGSWAQIKGANLASVNRVWNSSDFAGLGSNLPTDLSGTSVKVNGQPAAVYFASPEQVNFQVPSGISGTASLQVFNNGFGSNAVTSAVVSNAPGIVPIIANGTNYAGGVFLDGKYVGDPSLGSAFRKAKAGDKIQLYATGLVPSAAGVVVSFQPVSGVTVTMGNVTVSADAAGLVAPGEFQINFTVPQQFAALPEGSYPITITVNGVSSPATINSSPPGPLLVPVQH